MVYEGLENGDYQVEEHVLKPVVRNGFTVVEWGGSPLN